MSNSGNPNTDMTAEFESNNAPRRPSVLMIAVIIAFGLALVVGFNILRVLYGVIAPPLPPVPQGVVEISHESEAYGADVWSYGSTAESCSVIAYLQEQGGVCVVSPLECTGTDMSPDRDSPTTQVGRCHGSVEFSIFYMQWWAEVVRDNESPGAPTILNVEREVFWIGTGPQAAIVTP